MIQHSITELLTFSLWHFKGHLLKHGYNYFAKRGFDDYTMSNFNVGYAANDLVHTLKGHGANLEVAELAGLIGLHEGRHYDFFRNRLMFPILDIEGAVIGFGGRVLGDDLPKYLNTSETLVYEKSKVLYGLDLAKERIQNTQNVYLCEGYTDVMRMHQKDLTNAVATCGTSLTEKHIAVLKPLTNKVTLLFDGDKAGVKAAARSINLLLSNQMKVRIVSLPNKHDPCSFAEVVSNEDFVSYITKREQTFISYLSAHRWVDKNSPSDKAKMIHEVCQSIACLEEAARGAAIDYACDLWEFNYAKSAVIGQVNKYVINH